MISICGDVHGFYELVVDYSRMAKEAGCVALCQVGDWGMHMREIHAAIVKSNYPHIPVYVIPGNHEYFDSWEGFEETKEVMHNVTFVQRGHIMKVDGLNVLFFGGASSIDKSYQGKNWDWREDIQPKDVERFEKNLLKLEARGEKVDIMITHVPPHRVIKSNFDARGKLAFGVGLDWEDKSAPIVEKIWDRLGNPPLFSGHMHRKVVDGNCRILDINEFILYPEPLSLSADEVKEHSLHDGVDIHTSELQEERMKELDTVKSNKDKVVYNGVKYVIPPMLDIIP